MSEFEIRLLGDPEVLWHGQPFTIKRRITRIILFYLAAQEGLVNRTRLVNLFWGHKDEHSARTNLRQSLHRLRTALPDTSLLKEQGELVGLNFEETGVDLHQFTRDFHLIFPIVNHLPTSRPLPDEIFQQLLDLNNLWRGTSFLGESILPDTTELGEWISGINDRLQPLRRWVLERLSDHAYASNNFQESLAFATHALTDNEMNEGLHHRVLMALLLMNRSEEAQRHYKKMLKNSAKEGGQLSAEFHQQFDHLINPPTRPRSSGKVNWNIYTGIEMPFVGRRSELGILNKQFLAGGTVFIFGESGQGKTRLLATFAGQTLPASRTILARARAGESGLPYQPLVDALRRGVQPSEWLRLPGVWASLLSQLLPELAVLRSDLRPPLLTNPEQARAQLQEALRQLFLLIAQNQRLLLVLDDAQWSDEATLAAFEYLISRPPFDKHALLVIAARVEEPNPAVTRMHEHVIKDYSVKTIQLEQLQMEEIAQLIQSSLGVSASSEFIQHLARDSGGNPLYIGEILASLAAQNTTGLESEHLPTSENLTKFIQARLRSLPQETICVFEAAAVLGYDFSLVELSGTSQCPAEQLSEALSILEESHLLRVSPDQNGINQVRINFIHDKFREVQYQMISPILRPSLHHQAAETLQKRSGEKLDDAAAVIAQHLEQAGDCLAAFHMWIRAGIHSMGLFSIIEADLAFARAAAMIPRCGQELDDISIYELFETWGDMWSDRNATDRIARIGEHLIALGKERQSDLLTCSGHHRLGNASFTANDFQKGLQETTLALRYLPNLQNPKLNVRVLWELGVLQFMTGQVQGGEESLTRALDYLGDPDTAEPRMLHWMGGIYYELGMVKTISGWPSQGHDYAQHAISILQKIQDKYRLMVNSTTIMARSLIGLTDHYMGRFEEAAQQLQETLESATQAGLWRAVGYLHDYIAMNELVRGNLDEMLEHVEQAIQIGEQYKRKEIYSIARQVMGDAHIRLQDFQRAREYFALSLEQNQDTFLTPDLMIHLGYCDIALNNIEAGIDLVTQAEKICQDFGLGFIEVDANLAHFFYYANTGNWKACKERAKQCIRICKERNINSIGIFAEYFFGLSLLQTGESDGLEYLQQVAQKAQAAHDFQAEVLTRQTIALFMKKTGLDPAMEVGRLKVLFKRLEAHTQHQVFQDRFKLLLNNFAQQTGIPGLFPTF